MDIRRGSAMTGLEAAIVFIAFIVVASVFAYVVLGSGFFAAQKSGEAVHAGLEEAGSALRTAGSVLGHARTDGTILRDVDLMLAVVQGRGGCDMERVTYRVVTGEGITDIAADDPRIDLEWRTRQDRDEMLEEREVVRIRLDVRDFALQAGEEFTIEIVPATGAPLALTRSVPDGLSGNEWYELW